MRTRPPAAVLALVLATFSLPALAESVQVITNFKTNAKTTVECNIRKEPMGDITRCKGGQPVSGVPVTLRTGVTIHCVPVFGIDVDAAGHVSQCRLASPMIFKHDGTEDRCSENIVLTRDGDYSRCWGKAPPGRRGGGGCSPFYGPKC